SSKHRPKDNKVLVPATVDGERHQKLVIENVIPAMKARIPRSEGHTIFVQQDRAKPHNKGGSWRRSRRWWVTILSYRPSEPTQPDLNINDLGFFHSIQKLKEDMGVTNPEELVKVTVEVFDVYPWRHLSTCVRASFVGYGELLGSKGDNVFKIPYLSKERVEKAGKLPLNAPVDLVNTVVG
ncbi:unnamed protein product, partial [Choristocarpus tenellus]